jgi:flagella basal body P-ring formation protein FlgA
MMARKPIPPGTVISAKLLTRRHLVKKGNQVTITARNGNIAVRMSGTALEDGVRDEQIRVRNDSSQRTIKAVVRSQNQVEVDY